MTPPFLIHILNALKTWFLRVARRSTSFLFFFLSLLRRFSRCHAKPGDSRLSSHPHLSNGSLPRPLEGDIAGEDVSVCFSLLPPDPMGVEAAGEPPFPSDDPYTGTHSRPLRKGTSAHPLEGNEAATGRPGATETDGLHQGSMSSLHSPPQGETSVDNRSILNDPLQESSSPGSSRLSGLHEVSRTHLRPQGYMDDAHSINTTRTPSMRHLAPGMPYSQYASDSRVSISTGRSLTRSITGLESRQAAYRTHTGPVHSRLFRVHRSIHHGPPNTVSVPLDSPAQVVPVSNRDILQSVHFTAPPDSDGQPASQVVVVYDYDGPPIAPMTAVEVGQFHRRRPRVPNASKTIIPAMTIAFPAHDMDVPEGWTTLVHPEGSRYFVHKDKRTFTEMNICDPVICDDIEYYMQYLLGELQRSVEPGKLDMKQVDLVLEPKVFDDCSVVCCYYFVNHRDRCLFWLDDFHAEQILSECNGIENLSHIRLAVQAQYWKHWDRFPSLCLVTQDLVDDVKNILVHAACDHLTSTESPMAFYAIEVRELLSVVDRIKVHGPADQSMDRCHTATVIGRIMYAFSHNHFVNYHGEDCVRLIFEHIVNNWAYTPSPWIVILTPLLFFGSVTQIYELRRVFVNEVACTPRWNAFSLKSKEQLQDSNLLATVLLNANVGFLAVNSVDKDGRNAIQMASYASLVASMGSIILGLLLVSHNRTMGSRHKDFFQSGLHDRKYKLEKLALIYSLPKALLIWGMVFFFAAFSIDWWSAGDRTSRIFVGTVTLVVFATISNSILGMRAGDLLLSRLADAWKRVMEFVGIRRAQRDLIRNPRSYTEGISFAPIGPSQADAEGDAPMRSTSPSTTSPSFQSAMPGPDDRDSYLSYIRPIWPYDPTASLNSPQQPHDANSAQPESDSRAGPAFLSGPGSLQQIRDELDAAPLGVHLTTPSSSASEGAVGTAVDATLHLSTAATEHELRTAVVATGTGAPTLPGPSRTEERENMEYTENVIESREN